MSNMMLRHYILLGIFPVMIAALGLVAQQSTSSQVKTPSFPTIKPKEEVVSAEATTSADLAGAPQSQIVIENYQPEVARRQPNAALSHTKKKERAARNRLQGKKKINSLVIEPITRGE